MNSTPLAIRFNDTFDPERPCAVCRAPHRLWTGQALVVEGTMDPVCDDCGNEIAPELMFWMYAVCLPPFDVSPIL